MSTANKNNITKYADVSRKLTRLELDTNFQEVKNVIDDVDNIETVIVPAIEADIDFLNTKLDNTLDEVANAVVVVADNIEVIQEIAPNVPTIVQFQTQYVDMATNIIRTQNIVAQHHAFT